MSDSDALVVRLKVEAAHPGIRIITPLASISGRWELEIGEADTTSYSDFWTMIDHLAALFADIEALAGAARLRREPDPYRIGGMVPAGGCRLLRWRPPVTPAPRTGDRS